MKRLEKQFEFDFMKDIRRAEREKITKKIESIRDWVVTLSVVALAAVSACYVAPDVYEVTSRYIYSLF